MFVVSFALAEEYRQEIFSKKIEFFYFFCSQDISMNNTVCKSMKQEKNMSNIVVNFAITHHHHRRPRHPCCNIILKAKLFFILLLSHVASINRIELFS